MPKKKVASDSSDSDSGPDDRTPVKKAKKSDDGKTEFELGKNRRVSVSTFKGKVLVDIREMYDKGGVMAPGKKGISLSTEQWKMLLEHADAINDAIKEV